MKEKHQFIIVILISIIICYLMAEYKLPIDNKASPYIIRKIN
jgi:hypothetical protein